MRKNLVLGLKGAAMGMAEVVPGVSGGTIAFITGIYEELIQSIRSVNAHQIKLLFQGKWKRVWININGFFLLQLAAGMALGIVFGVLVLSHLIEEYPEILWAFFFGLILASSLYVLSLVEDKSLYILGLIIISALAAYGITELSPAEGSDNSAVVFGSGIIAVSALLLPGLSGSFILLVLGMYTIVLGEAKEAIAEQSLSAFINIGLFSLGCALGLVLFSRVLGFLFTHHKNTTLAVLCGFMIGSLNKIWPWREAVLWMNKQGEFVENAEQIEEDYRILQEIKVLPQYYSGEPYLLWSTIAFAAGFLIVLFLWKIDSSGKPGHPSEI
ncbi:MAG: DUF368 domain-containing protein [Bacteroidetes bacterium]|jgi:putative membrane protein|nr:DUF368 domain-containing protein [Bacteroidota bacterium]